MLKNHNKAEIMYKYFKIISYVTMTKTTQGLRDEISLKQHLFFNNAKKSQ